MNEKMIELYNTLSIVSSVGIESLIVEPTEDDKTRFRGIDDKGSVLICDDFDDQIVESGLAIHSLRILLSRFNLFNDLKDVTFNIENRADGEWAKKIHMKSKDIVLPFTFSDKDGLSVPKKVPSVTKIGEIVFDKDEFSHFSSVIKSMRLSKSYDERVTFRNKAGTVYMEMNDGVSDTFSKKMVEIENKEGFTFKTRTDSIEKLIKQALNYSDKVSLELTDRGVAFIRVDSLNFMVSPE